MLSDETPDRMDDVIMSDGWDLANFNKNPIALFGHQSSFPIGKWKNVRVVDKQLRGFLELAPEGTSERIDEIRRLVDADILRAVSVGFRPKESKPRAETDWGLFFTKSELVETSLVSVPANPNALAVAKSLKISRATSISSLPGKARRTASNGAGITGGQADKSSLVRKGTTMSFAQKITACEQRINTLRDQLAAHWEKTDETNVSDEQLKIATDLNEKIEREEKTREALVAAEKSIGQQSEDVGMMILPLRPNSSERPSCDSRGKTDFGIRVCMKSVTICCTSSAAQPVTVDMAGAVAARVDARRAEDGPEHLRIRHQRR